jgi:cephalosporin hydroxylase
MSSEDQIFEQERRDAIRRMAADADFIALSAQWMRESLRHRYSYNFRWLGMPVIQHPNDLIAMQELVWKIRPARIVETGVARGGSLVFYASLLALLGGDARVVGIDVDIRPHNRAAIERHPLAARIDLVEGSSIDPAVVRQVTALVGENGPVLVCLDSNHTHDHVLAELHAYAPLVRKGSYIVVFDTVIEAMPPGFYPDRPWGRGNNPLSAVRSFLAATDRFAVDTEIDAKLLLSVAQSGFLRCVKDP